MSEGQEKGSGKMLSLLSSDDVRVALPLDDATKHSALLRSAFPTHLAEGDEEATARRLEPVSIPRVAARELQLFAKYATCFGAAVPPLRLQRPLKYPLKELLDPHRLEFVAPFKYRRDAPGAVAALRGVLDLFKAAAYLGASELLALCGALVAEACEAEAGVPEILQRPDILPLELHVEWMSHCIDGWDVYRWLAPKFPRHLLIAAARCDPLWDSDEMSPTLPLSARSWSLEEPDIIVSERLAFNNQTWIAVSQETENCDLNPFFPNSLINRFAQLHLRRCRCVNDAGLAKVARLAAIKRVWLEDMDSITCAGVCQLCSAATLRELRLVRCRSITALLWEAMASSTCNLTSLTVDACSVDFSDDADFRALASAAPRLEALAIQRTRVAVDAVHHLARDFPLLSALDLSHVSCAPPQGAALSFQALPRFVHLECLALAGHSSAVSDALLESVVVALRHLRRLTLDDAGDRLTDRGIALVATLPLLTCLSLNRCSGFGDQGLIALAQSQLQLCHLSACHCARITELGVRAVLSSLPSLQTFRVTGFAGYNVRCHHALPREFPGCIVIA